MSKLWIQILEAAANLTRSITFLDGTPDADVIGLDGVNGLTVIVGRGGPDLLFGGNGKDVLIGGRGDDALHGGNGNDYLRGDAGDDTMTGGNGRDLFTSFMGSDTLTGGNGVDTFVFRTKASDDVSVVTDFDGDEILIKGRGYVEATQTDAGVMLHVGDNEIALLAGYHGEVEIGRGGPSITQMAFELIGLDFV